MDCDTCARRMYCPLYKKVRPPCPYYVPDYWYGRPLTTDGDVVGE